MSPPATMLPHVHPYQHIQPNYFLGHVEEALELDYTDPSDIAFDLFDTITPIGELPPDMSYQGHVPPPRRSTLYSSGAAITPTYPYPHTPAIGNPSAIPSTGSIDDSNCDSMEVSDDSYNPYLADPSYLINSPSFQAIDDGDTFMSSVSDLTRSDGEASTSDRQSVSSEDDRKGTSPSLPARPTRPLRRSQRAKPVVSYADTTTTTTTSTSDDDDSDCYIVDDDSHSSRSGKKRKSRCESAKVSAKKPKLEDSTDRLEGYGRISQTVASLPLPIYRGKPQTAGRKREAREFGWGKKPKGKGKRRSTEPENSIFRKLPSGLKEFAQTVPEKLKAMGMDCGSSLLLSGMPFAPLVTLALLQNHKEMGDHAACLQKPGPSETTCAFKCKGGVNCKVSTATSTGMEHAFFRLANSDHVKAKYRVLRICPLCGHSFKPRSDAWSDYHVAQCWEEHQVEVEDECKEDLELVLWDLKEDFRNSYHLQFGTLGEIKFRVIQPAKRRPKKRSGEEPEA